MELILRLLVTIALSKGWGLMEVNKIIILETAMKRFSW